MTRLAKVRQKMKENNIEAFLVSNLTNLFYLADFTGTAGTGLISEDKAYFITDSRYKEQAQQQASPKGFEVIIHQSGLNNTLYDLLEKLGVSNLAFEADTMTAVEYLTFASDLSLDLIPVVDFIRQIRAIKDQAEIEKLQIAAQITDQTFDHILNFIKPGQTSELQVAHEIDRYFKELGSSGISFETIVASGYRSSMPHGTATDKIIQEGDMVTIDFGCIYQGYISDMTRTFAVGSVDSKLEEIYQIVFEANRLVTQATRPGITGAQLDAVARDYISQKGYGDKFGHSTGHGIGLDVHELPNISYRNDQALVPGNAITNEPGIYIEGLGGVRIEDDLVITEDGCRILTKSPRELIHI